ncbi:tetratricopeptide repeat protein [Arsenicibacter rosenii]|uniref:Tetratricopeptide repeat protein n=1 Tax=Arsenicibacter rosenii TaxID=1750698 RepID=A0A1S2VE72_9BACT|nr:hypothetical protein [Arsenicibacter rosenii]OIN57009.1 hypothetical protein BLX24_21905 [Arsenicibacter rosenii]
MKQLYIMAVLLFIGSALPVFAATPSGTVPHTVPRPTLDDEYDKYKKKADDLLKQGRYLEARRQYQNCLEVPGFEKDPYATARIADIDRCLYLRDQAVKAISARRGAEAVGFWQQVLTINPGDMITKSNLTDYWTDQGNIAYAWKKYGEAKKAYTEALSYAVKKDILQIQIQNSDNYLKEAQAVQAAKEAAKPVAQTPVTSVTTAAVPPSPVPSVPVRKPAPVSVSLARTGVIAAIGVVGLGANIYAYTLKSEFNNKLGELKSINASVDPDNDGTILTQAEKDQWDKAYNAAEKARSKNSLYKACIGVASAAVLAEVYFLIRKPKTNRKSLSWQPAPTGVGVAARYTF